MGKSHDQHIYKLIHHSHGNHAHINLRKKGDHDDHSHNHDDSHHHDHDHNNCGSCEDSHDGLGKNEEGCPCCAAAIDLDEVATALNELMANSGGSDGHAHLFDKLADFSSSAHWGIFLGISGPLGLIGLTAAIRNVEGTLNNREKLNKVIKGLKKDIDGYKDRRDKSHGKNKKDLTGVIQRLEAFQETLEYSKFDTDFNLAVPGVINGAASAAVLSTGIAATPLALPLIALYAGCQTVRNGYDLWRIWNRILPAEIREEVELNTKVGVRKINQITDSKRKFYAANSLGFATFTAGAAVTGLSAFSVIGAPGMLAGIPLLGAGAIATGVTNNLWTNKFKPRNADLGVSRVKLDLENIPKEIGKRRTVKKLLKNYRNEHLPQKSAKFFGASLLASLPFLDKKGATLRHKVNQSRVAESNSSDKDRLDLLERVINANRILKKAGNQKEVDSLIEKTLNFREINQSERKKFELVTLDREKPICEEIFKACGDVGIDDILLDRFIQNVIIKPSEDHDTSIKNKEDFVEKITGSGLFHVTGDEVTFDLKALEENDFFKNAFMNSLEEFLLFDYVEKLKYEQYGLNDFYWALDKQNKKNPLSKVDKDHDHSHNDHQHCHHDHQHDHSHSYEHAHHHEHEHCDSVHAPLVHPDCDKISSSEKDDKNCALSHSDSTHDYLVNSDCDKALSRKEEESGLIPSKVSQKNLDEAHSETDNQEVPLDRLKSLVIQKVSQNEKERHEQITQQSETIDEVTKECQEFILKSTVKDEQRNKTIFTYIHPNHQDAEDADHELTQVVYLRDDVSGKVDVLYGEKTNALVLERPTQARNATVTQIDKGEAEHYGQMKGSVFQSFSKLEKSAQKQPYEIPPESPTISPKLSDSAVLMDESKDKALFG